MSRISVMNGWKLAPHCWWRFILMPFNWDHCPQLGWSSFSAFGFTFFWMHKLTPEQKKVVRENGRKLIVWAQKHGKRVD